MKSWDGQSGTDESVRPTEPPKNDWEGWAFRWGSCCRMCRALLIAGHWRCRSHDGVFDLRLISKVSQPCRCRRREPYGPYATADRTHMASPLFQRKRCRKGEQRRSDEYNGAHFKLPRPCAGVSGSLQGTRSSCGLERRRARAKENTKSKNPQRTAASNENSRLPRYECRIRACDDVERPGIYYAMRHKDGSR